MVMPKTESFPLVQGWKWSIHSHWRNFCIMHVFSFRVDFRMWSASQRSPTPWRSEIRRQIADVWSDLQRLHGELLLRLMALRPPWRQRPPEGLPNLHLVSKPNKICPPTTRYYRYFQDNAVCCQKSRALNTLSSNMPINGHWMGKSSNQTLIFHCHVWWSEGESHFLIRQDCTQHHRYVWELDKDRRNIISSCGYTWPMAWSPRFCPSGLPSLGSFRCHEVPETAPP
jgi:hypothetical protein